MLAFFSLVLFLQNVYSVVRCVLLLSFSVFSYPPCAFEGLTGTVEACLISFTWHSNALRPVKVIASSEESKNHWQQRDYKGFNSSTDWDTADFSKVRFEVLVLHSAGQRVCMAALHVAGQRCYQ